MLKRRTSPIHVHALLGWLLSLAIPATSAMAETIVFRGGTLVDGSGDERREADVWVRDGRIAAVGEAPDFEADREIDISGKIIAPGFIDTHAHGNPDQTPLFENFLRMGVTTICLGQDGSSPFTDDLEDWRKETEGARLGLHIAPFVGHGTVRRRSGVEIDPEPSAEGIESMTAIVAKAMEAGAFGMTTGIEYHPGTFAAVEELAVVAAPVAEYGGLVQSHIRSEDEDEIIDALDELLEQGRRSGAKVHVSHIKIVFADTAEHADKVLAHLDAARKEGVEVTADLYPYTASFTGIGIVFPDWAKPPHDYDELVENRRDDLAEFLRNRVQQRNGPEATLFGTGEWRGKTLAEAAEEAGMAFEDLLIDMGPRGASAAYFVMNEAVMERLLADPHVMISSDGSPTMRHPRGYGSFARILAKYVRDQELLSLEEGIRKMTGLPAETLGLDREPDNNGSPRRGRIEADWAADLVVFDLEKVNDRATFEEPHAFAEGFSHVMIDGVMVIEDERLTRNRPGKVLRMTPKP